MKKILLAMVFVFIIPAMLLADEVDKGLPPDTPSSIKESARQVIQLGIETNAVIKMTRSMLGDNFSEQQIIAGHELLIKTRKQNISEEPIINKLHEGIAKNVSAENILQAMEKVRVRYEVANAYTQNMRTDQGQAPAMAKEMAECMAAGMDKDGMNKIMEMLQNKTRNATKNEAFELNEKTLYTARTLARSGVGSKDIVNVLNNAFQMNYNAREMEKLGNTFMRQAKGMSSASDLAKSYSIAIKRGATPDSIASYTPITPSLNDSIASTGTPPPNNGMGGGASPPNGAAVGMAPPGGGGPRPAAAGAVGAAGAPAPPQSGATPGSAPGIKRP
jgi:hypothetical protein